MRRRIGRIDDADAEPLAAGWLCSPIYGLITAPNSGITGQWLGKFLISDIVAHQATKTSWMKSEGQVWWPWIGQQAPSIHHCIESTCIIVILLVVSLLSYPQNPKDSPKPYHVLSMFDIPRLYSHSELNPNACYPSVDSRQQGQHRDEGPGCSRRWRGDQPFLVGGLERGCDFSIYPLVN